MICPHCGVQNDDGANFCRMCATKLREVCDCWVKKSRITADRLSVRVTDSLSQNYKYFFAAGLGDSGYACSRSTDLDLKMEVRLG